MSGCCYTSVDICLHRLRGRNLPLTSIWCRLLGQQGVFASVTSVPWSVCRVCVCSRLVSLLVSPAVWSLSVHQPAQQQQQQQRVKMEAVLSQCGVFSFQCRSPWNHLCAHTVFPRFFFFQWMSIDHPCPFGDFDQVCVYVFFWWVFFWWKTVPLGYSPSPGRKEFWW